MKDFIGETIELADELYVMKPVEGELNEADLYKVSGFSGDKVIVKNDAGNDVGYDGSRFVVSAASRMFRDVADANAVTGPQVGEA
jgi:hypothetical protein